MTKKAFRINRFSIIYKIVQLINLELVLHFSTLRYKFSAIHLYNRHVRNYVQLQRRRSTARRFSDFLRWRAF